MLSKSIKTLTYLMPLLLMVAFVFVFSYEMILFEKIPIFRDLSPYFYPLRFSLAQSFKAGDFPLWEPRMAMGFPLLASFQSGVFYPPNLVYLLFPFFLAVKLTFLFHYLIASIGTYLLLRHWKFERFLALTGAVLFTFSGCIISLANLLNHFQAAVWLPWLVLYGEKQLVFARWWQIIPLALVATVQFLAGSPEIYAMTMILVALNGLRTRSESGASYRRVFLSLLLVNIVVAGLSMVQILPTLELLIESVRRGASLAAASQQSLHPVRLVNILFLDKEVNISSYETFKFFFYESPPLLMTLYMGSLFPLGFWVWWLTENKRRRRLVLAAIFISLMLALGYHTPLYGWLYRNLPLMNLTRYPEKFFFLTFSVLLYATLKGLSRLFQAERLSFFKALAGPAILGTILIVIYFVFRIHRQGLLQLVAFAKGMPVSDPLAWDISSAVLVHLERQIILSLSLLGLLAISLKGIARQSFVQVVIMAIAFVDLVSAHQPYQFLMKLEMMEKRPELLGSMDNLSLQRVFFTSPDSPLYPTSSHFARARSPIEYTTFAFETLRPNTGIAWGVSYMQEMEAIGRKSFDLFLQVAKTLPAERIYRMLGILNVKYLVSLHELTPGPLTLVRYFPEYPAWLYRINPSVPRAYIVPYATYERDPAKTIERMASDGFYPLKEVVVNEPVSLPTRRDFRAKAKIVVYKNRTVHLQVSSNSPGILILADSFYPGWRAYVDGKERKILRANFFFRGVPLPAGEHLVEFHYQPRSFTIGLIITLTTLCGVGILCFVFRALGKKQSTSTA